MAGINKRPRFQSREHAEWFERTPKWVLYEILKDITTMSQFDSAESDEAQDGWLGVAKGTQDILKNNGII